MADGMDVTFPDVQEGQIAVESHEGTVGEKITNNLDCLVTEAGDMSVDSSYAEVRIESTERAQAIIKIMEDLREILKENENELKSLREAQDDISNKVLEAMEIEKDLPA